MLLDRHEIHGRSYEPAVPACWSHATQRGFTFDAPPVPSRGSAHHPCFPSFSACRCAWRPGRGQSDQYRNPAFTAIDV